MSASTGLTLATEVERHHQGGLAVKEEFSFYVGVDWGVEFHQACILDSLSGAFPGERRTLVRRYR